MKRRGPTGAVGEGAEVPVEVSCKGTDGRLQAIPTASSALCAICSALGPIPKRGTGSAKQALMLCMGECF
jgi:hypothetical protein